MPFVNFCFFVIEMIPRGHIRDFFFPGLLFPRTLMFPIFSPASGLGLDSPAHTQYRERALNGSFPWRFLLLRICRFSETQTYSRFFHETFLPAPSATFHAPLLCDFQNRIFFQLYVVGTSN